MWFRNLFDYLASTSSRTPAGRARRVASRRRPAATRLQLEALEDRCLLSFSLPVSFPVGITPLAVADFNGDGNLDLVTNNATAHSVSILLGNGDGTFQPAQNFAIGSAAAAVAVVDFNGDGKLDIVTADATNFGVLLGNGDGTFQAPQSFALPALPGQFPPGYTGSTALPQAANSVVLGDLNGDGKLDLAIRGQTTFTMADGPTYFGYDHYYTTYRDGYVNVLLGNGDGTFTPKAVYHLDNHADTGIGTQPFAFGNGNPSVLGLGDLNGDGKLDVVAVSTIFGGVSVLPGNGDGTLGAPVHSASGVGFNSVVTGDLNADGKLDLVTVGGGSVLVQKGNGDGTFQAPQTFAAGSTVQSVVLGDVNGDGKLDIIALTSATQFSSCSYYACYDPVTTSYATVLLGHGDGAFTRPYSSTLGSQAGYGHFSALALGDFNGDGRPDLAATDPSTNTVSVALNRNDWSGPTYIDVSGFPLSPTAGVAGTFTATIRDSLGNTVTGYRGTVQLSSTDSQAVLAGPYTFTAADAGTHSFRATLKTAGTQSLTVTDATSGGVTGTESGITVNPASASTITVAGFPSSTTAGVAHTFIITALDPYGNIVTGHTSVVHFSSSDAQAVLPPDSLLFGSGIGSFSATFNTAGTQSLTATDTTNSSLTGTQGGITVYAAVKTLTVAGFPSPITAGVAGSVTVTAKDGNGNVATWYTGTVVLSSSDSQVTWEAYTFTAADKGVHTFSAILYTAGTQSITVKDSVTVGLSGSEMDITVRPAAASKFLISAPASVRSGKAFSLTITVQDAYGNVVTGYTGTIHFTSTDRRASLPANYTFLAADRGMHTFIGLKLRQKGTQTITVTDTLKVSITSSVIVNVV